MKRIAYKTTIALAILLCVQIAIAQTPGLRWFKGNTHTHTTNSDGDSAPEIVADWYKKNGYDFLFFTDHEHITPVGELNAKLGDNGKFLLINGQEITDRFDRKPYHVNGLGLTEVVRPKRGTTIVSNVQLNVDAVRAAGALPQINHPNYGWALTAAELAQIKGATLIEIHSGHPLVNMAGGGGVPSVESMWDTVLSGGMVIYAVAVDDVHHFKRLGDRAAATPGHGWVMVRAAQLDPKSILSALERGDFYASSGVELESYDVSDREIRVKVKEARGRKYTTHFIGSGGKVLQSSVELESVYRRKKSERYVRVKVIDSNGMMAWTQPVFPATK